MLKLQIFPYLTILDADPEPISTTTQIVTPESGKNIYDISSRIPMLSETYCKISKNIVWTLQKLIQMKLLHTGIGETVAQMGMTIIGIGVTHTLENHALI